MYVQNNFHRRLLTGAMLARMSIDVLPDVALLEIFDFHLKDRCRDDPDQFNDPFTFMRWPWAWKPLVHVCRKWRNVVLGSPLRLNLRLYCKPHESRARALRESMAIWPSLPIVVSDNCDKIRDNETWMDSIVAVFELSAQRSRMSIGNRRDPKSTTGNTLGSNATAIPGIDASMS